MPEYRFFPERIFPYKDRIFDSVFVKEYMDQRKPVLWHILRSEYFGLHFRKVSLKICKAEINFQ